MSNVTPIDPTLYLFTGEPAHIDTDSQAMLVASYSELCSYSCKANDDEPGASWQTGEAIRA